MPQTNRPAEGLPSSDDREHLRLVVEATPVAIIAIDDRGTIRLANTQAQVMFGYNAAELIGKSVDLLVPERFSRGHAALRGAYERAPAIRPMGTGRDLCGRRKDGTELPIEVGLNPITTTQGKFFLASVVDLTERKRTDEVVRNAELRSRRQAERLEALWQIANNPTLRGQDIILSMLRQAASAIRVTQHFRGILGRIEGDEVVVVSVGIDPTDRDPSASRIAVGARTAIARTIISRVQRSEGWDDLAAMEDAPEYLAELGWRSAISTKFDAGGLRYSLTFASPEPTSVPFGPEDFAYLELLASAFASHLQVRQLEDSLRDAEERTRQHAERLEALWRIINNTGLRDEELWLAMLREASAAIRPGQGYQGTLWRVQGTDLVLEAVTEPSQQAGAVAARAGASIPLENTAAGKVLAEGGGTRAWDDLQASTDHGALALALGTRSFIATTFTAGGTTWGVSFASTQPSIKPLGPYESAYIEVLASFFANHVQQRWQFDRIQYQQSHDVLTGLLNRSQFRSRARMASRTAGHFAVILVDINALHEINETYGNMIGDALLVEVGNALRQRTSIDEFVGRVAGDVFGIYVSNAVSKVFVRSRVQEFAGTFSRGFSTGDREGKEFIALTASLGAALAPEDGEEFDSILSHADAALLAAKERGHGSILFYEPGMEGDAHRRAALRSGFDLHAAAWQYGRDALVWADAETGRILDVNPQAERLFGRAREDLIGLTNLDLHPRDLHAIARQGFALHADGTTDPVELDIERADGERVPTEIRAQVVGSGAKRMLLGTFRDLTRLRAARLESARRAAALGAIHHATMAATQAESDRALMEAICDGIIVEGAYRTAFVGLANDDAEQTITIAAASGGARGYLDEERLVWSDQPRGRGPTGRAIRLGTTQIVNRVRDESHLEPWADQLRHFEVAAMLSVPLIESERPFGALTIYAKAADVFSDVERHLFEDLARQLVLGMRLRRERDAYTLQVVENVRKEAQIQRALEQTVGAVSTTIEQRDPYTAGHSRAVADLSERIANRLGLSRERSHGIYLAGLVHDVGKIRIPAEILGKPGKLSALEYEMIQDHAFSGYEILHGVEFPWPISEAAYQHHERLDGSGYPRGLRGNDIILEARIVAVADIIDSMATHRPYRAALPRDHVIEEIKRQRGALLDAAVVDAALLELAL